MKAKRLAVVLAALLIFAYPFAVYFGISYFSPRYVALALIGIFLLRFILIKPKAISTYDKYTKSGKYIVLFTTITGIIVSMIGAISNQVIVIKFYPVAVSLLLFTVFFYSLIHPPTVIEKLARIKDPKLSQAAIKYTRKVTVVWCMFFIINGAIALYSSLFSSFKFWTFYNGFLSYILIGAICATEFTYRQWAKKRHPF